MPIFTPSDDSERKFTSQFMEIDGKFYFSVSDVEWLLPIDDDVIWRKLDQFRILYGLAALIHLAIMLICMYLIVANDLAAKYFLLLIPAMLAGIVLHFWALHLPTVPLFRALRTLARLPDEIKNQNLLARP